MSEYIVVFPLDEFSMEMAMLLDDIIANDVDVEFVTTRGVVDALVEAPGSPSVPVGRSAGREGLFAACARSLSRLEIARDALVSRMGQHRPVRRRIPRAVLNSQRDDSCPPGFEPV